MLQFKDNFLFTKKPKIYGFFFFLKFSSFLNTQIEPNQILTYQACNFCTKQTQEYLSRCKHVQDMFVNRLTKFFSGNTKHQRFTQNDAISLSTFFDDTNEVSFHVFLSYTISHRKYGKEVCLAFKLLFDICNNYKPSLLYIVI